MIDWQRILRKHIRLIVASTLVCTFCALGFAICKKEVWTATQGLLVRDEALGDMQRVGRFDSTDAMQTAQETILELSRFPSVMRPALTKVGPAKATKKSFPSEKDIEALQKSINVSAPGGAQFGRTEMIYLTVKANNSNRAVALTNSVVDQLEKQLQLLRRERYVSIIAELERTVKIAQDELNKATEEIEHIESIVGTDLVSLRDITDNQAGEGSLVREFSDLKKEIRAANAVIASQENLRSVLIKAYRNPKSIVATPNDLLITQPSIKRLKDGLIDAQLRTSRLLGIMTPQHPNIKAAKLTEKQIQSQLHNELKVAIRGLDADLEVSRGKARNINLLLGSSEDSLLSVGKLRARYSNLRSEVENKTEFLDQAVLDLAKARGNQRASTEVSFLTRVDKPIPSIRPVGPGKKTIVLGGIFGGLAIAGGLIFLLEPIGAPRPAPSGDLHQMGYWGGPNRRLADQITGRRATDHQLENRRENPDPKRRATDALPASHRALLEDFTEHLTKRAHHPVANRKTTVQNRPINPSSFDTPTNSTPPGSPAI